MSAARSRPRPSLVVEPRAVDLPTAAGVYGISESTLRDLIERGEFPHLRIGRRIVVPLAAADQWLVERAAAAPLRP